MDTSRLSQSSKSSTKAEQSHRIECGRRPEKLSAEITSRQKIEETRKSKGLRDRSGISERSIEYAAVIHRRLNSRDEKLGDEFVKRFGADLLRSASSSADPVLRAANSALEGMSRDGKISADEAGRIRDQAAKESSQGSAHGRIGAAAVSGRMRAQHTQPSRSDRGEANAATSAAQPAVPTTSSAPFGFLWKPISESDGNLVVLLPETWGGSVESVALLLPDGTELEGTFKDFFEGTKRAIFRFNKPGSVFPRGTFVQVSLDDGSTRTIAIPNPAARFEGR